MTARPDMVAIELPQPSCRSSKPSKKPATRAIPVYEEDIDHIVGILYARDLLQFVGTPPEQFSIRTVLRPAFLRS